MPRDGTQQYVLPFPDVEPGTTIESTVYNGFTHDVAIDLNTPRPISSGGTGANNAHDAMLALNGEIALQNVANYDSFPFVAGSFYSAPGATSAPEATAVYGGICYVYSDPNFMALEARNLSVPSGPLWVRQKVTGTWQPWVQQVGGATDATAANDARYVNVTGDTMTGTLSAPNVGISAANPVLSLYKTTGGAAGIYSYNNGLARWGFILGDTAPESSGNLGANFVLAAYDDAGSSVISTPLYISRQTGLLILAGDPTAALGAATKQYVDALKQYVDALKQHVDDKSAGLFIADRNNIDQTGMTASGFNRVQFNNEIKDANNWYDSVTNFRYAPQLAGTYLFSLAVTAANGTSGETCQAIIYKNGVSNKVGTYIGSGSATSSWQSHVIVFIPMNGTTDYVEAWAYMPAARTTMFGGPHATHFQGLRVGD